MRNVLSTRNINIPSNPPLDWWWGGFPASRLLVLSLGRRFNLTWLSVHQKRKVTFSKVMTPVSVDELTVVRGGLSVNAWSSIGASALRWGKKSRREPNFSHPWTCMAIKRSVSVARTLLYNQCVARVCESKASLIPYKHRKIQPVTRNSWAHVESR